MIRLASRLLITGAIAAFAATAIATPAAAIPNPGPYQSVTFTYYSNASKTVVVGGWSYGYCGEPFDWGQHTRYSTYRIINCQP